MKSSTFFRVNMDSPLNKKIKTNEYGSHYLNNNLLNCVIKLKLFSLDYMIFIFVFYERPFCIYLYLKTQTCHTSVCVYSVPQSWRTKSVSRHQYIGRPRHENGWKRIKKKKVVNSYSLLCIIRKKISCFE